MNRNSANYEINRPQFAVENVDFYKDKLPWTIKTLVIPALALIHSIGLSSSVGAINDPVSKNRPSVAAITIEVDPGVELVGIVFRLAGNYEFNQGRIPSYVRDLERQFGDFDDHPAVKLVARLRSTRRMSCDGPMSLAVIDVRVGSQGMCGVLHSKLV